MPAPNKFPKPAPAVKPEAGFPRLDVPPLPPPPPSAPVSHAPQPPFIGEIVLFVLTRGPSHGQVRPALVVNVHDGVPSLQVFVDGDGNKHGDHAGPVEWVQRVPYDEREAEGTWHRRGDAAK